MKLRMMLGTCAILLLVVTACSASAPPSSVAPQSNSEVNPTSFCSYFSRQLIIAAFGTTITDQSKVSDVSNVGGTTSRLVPISDIDGQVLFGAQGTTGVTYPDAQQTQCVWESHGQYGTTLSINVYVVSSSAAVDAVWKGWTDQPGESVVLDNGMGDRAAETHLPAAYTHTIGSSIFWATKGLHLIETKLLGGGGPHADAGTYTGDGLKALMERAVGHL